VPSLTSVAMQNVVARHQVGISIGSMNFSRNLYTTMLIAVFGAIVVAGTAAGQPPSGTLQAGAGDAAEAFSRVFFTAAASMSIALVAIAIMEQKPLQTSAEIDAQ
jgi:hypothetical protein